MSEKGAEILRVKPFIILRILRDLKSKNYRCKLNKIVKILTKFLSILCNQLISNPVVSSIAVICSSTGEAIALDVVINNKRRDDNDKLILIKTSNKTYPSYEQRREDVIKLTEKLSELDSVSHMIRRL